MLLFGHAAWFGVWRGLTSRSQTRRRRAWVLLRHQHGDDLAVAPAASGSDRSFWTRPSRCMPGGVTLSAMVISQLRNTPSWACDEEEEYAPRRN